MAVLFALVCSYAAGALINHRGDRRTQHFFQTTAKGEHEHHLQADGFLGEGSSTRAPDPPPVSPAMRSVAVLTILYFSAYMAIVLVRGCSTLMARQSDQRTRTRGPPARGAVEASLEKSTETLMFVPMTCILMISARLRAMQLTEAGNPQPWAQTCMYLCTWAIVTQFVLQLVSPADEEDAEGAKKVWISVVRVLRFSAMLVLYVGVIAIIVSVYVIEAPKGKSTPPVSPMMQCVSTLTVCYFGIHFGIILTRCLRWAMGQRSSQQRMVMENQLEQASATLAFAPMLCVLMVGVRMRALQLGQEPPTWAQTGMFVASWGLVVQACAVALVTCQALLSKQDETSPPFPTSQSSPSAYKLEWGAALGKGAFGAAMTWTRFGAMLCMYVAITVIIVSLFMMEGTETFTPEIQKDAVKFLSGGDPQQLHHFQQQKSGPALPTAMRCVTILSVLYFSLYLCIVLAHSYQQVKLSSGNGGGRSGRVEAVLENSTKSLVFVPMLSVMMIGLRLRAKQLGNRDPQTWAQTAMYASTFAILVQVLAAILSSLVCAWQVDDDDDDMNDQPRDGMHELRLKVALWFCLAVRYLAMMCLYGGMGLLLVALFAMEKSPTEAWAMEPNVDHLSDVKMK